MPSERFSAVAKGLPVAAAVTSQTALTGIETGGPTAQTYAPSATGAANSLVATNANGEITGQHFIGAGSTPTVAAGPGLGATTGPTISITGTDASFNVTATTTSSGSAGVLFTVTFATPFATAPFPVFSAASSATAGDLTATHTIYATATSTTLTLTAGSGTFNNGITVSFNIKT